MNIAANGADPVSAPANYADLFQQYYGYVVSLVRRSGIEISRAEDVASEILLRFFERDFLNVFDPTLVFHYQGRAHPARFKSFLTKFVLTYLRGHIDRQDRLHRRELLLCDNPVAATGVTCWLDVFGDTVDGPDSEIFAFLEEQELVARLRRHIAGVPKRSALDTCDLVALFDAVIEQIRTDGRWNITSLRRRFGVSSTAMHSWMWWLRTNIAAALRRPVPAKRPRTLRSAA